MRYNGKGAWKRKWFVLILAGLPGLSLYQQDVTFVVPNKHFTVACGTGIDTRLYLQSSGADPVYVSATTPQGIEAVVQPDTLYGPATVVLSLLVTDSTLAGDHYPVYINSSALMHAQTDTLDLEVIMDNPAYMDQTLAGNYRDSALHFIMQKYPNAGDLYGDLLAIGWTGFYPYPPPDIVSHFVCLHGNWRINLLWHVMVPPYDWVRVFVYNDEEEVAWGVLMDSGNRPREIPPEKHYYFSQDTTVVSGTGDTRGGGHQPVICPNPFTSSTVIILRNPDHEPFTFYLFDMNGRLIRHITGILSDRLTLQREGLEPGIYYYRITGSAVFQGRIIAM